MPAVITAWKELEMIPKWTGLYVSFICSVGGFFGVSAHAQAEEWESGIIPHQKAEGGVKISAIPLSWHRPASQLTEVAHSKG